MPTSPAGSGRPVASRAAAGGFSLIELIVVVALIGIALAGVLSFTVGSQDTARLQGSARELWAFLKVARGYAVVEGRDNRLVFDTETRSFKEALRGKRLRLPDGVVLTAGLPPEAGRHEVVVFYADGSADRVELTLSSGAKRLTVRVDPVLGEASVSKEAGPAS